jgi:hypothetical protein
MCPLSDPDSKYQDCVDRWVRNRLDEGGPQTWDDLVRSLPGIDPGAVLDSVRRHNLSESVEFDQPEDVSFPSVFEDVGLQARGIAALPTPHPLDYCWWFDTHTISEIVSSIRRFSSLNAHVALLGTPTVFDVLTNGADTRRFSLIDADPLVVGRFGFGLSRSVIFANLLHDDVHLEPAELVVADPPWYPLETRAFLWAARQVSTRGSFVVMSVPPEGTRPGVTVELDGLVHWASTLGLEVDDYLRGVVSYVSPLFERNAFLAASVPPPQAAWRRGDLIRFKCVGSCTGERPAATSFSRWHERVFDDVRIRVRDNGTSREWRDPTLGKLTESDVLPTVSRRDYRRDLVDVWTCGNRVFRCHGTGILLSILDAIAVNDSTVAWVERFSDRQLTPYEAVQVNITEERLRGIIQAEGREVSTWREHHARVDIVTS